MTVSLDSPGESSEGLVARFTSEPEWEEASRAFLDMNHLQLWNFNVAAARRIGARPEHIAFRSEGSLVGLAAVRVKNLPLFGGGIAYVAGGPLTRRGSSASEGAFLHCLDVLRQEYVIKRGMVLRVLAPLGPDNALKEQEVAFSRLGLSTSTRARSYRTIVVPIDRQDTDILQSFAPKWRGHLRRAQRAGLSIRQGTAVDLFEKFRPLFDQLRGKKGFEVDLPPGFYHKVQAALPESSRFVIHLAEIGGEPAAGVICSIVGDTAVYLFGAADGRGRQVAASYLLQFEAIRYARNKGCRWYDLGGIDPQGNPDVYHFKVRMGDRDITIPTMELAEGLRGRLTLRAEGLYRTIRSGILRGTPAG